MNLYDVLEIPDNATSEVIKAAYRRLASKWHPDRNDAPEATAKFQEIERAYSVLSNQELKQKYDETGSYPGSGPSKEEQLHAGAVRVLRDVLQAHNDPLTVDLVSQMVCAVQNHQKRIEQEKQQIKGNIEKLKKLVIKFSRGDKENLISAHLSAEVENLERQMQMADNAIAEAKELEEYIKTYSFTPDVRNPEQTIICGNQYDMQQQGFLRSLFGFQQ